MSHIAAIKRLLKEPSATILFRIAMLCGKSIEMAATVHDLVLCIGPNPFAGGSSRVQGRCQELPRRVRF